MDFYCTELNLAIEVDGRNHDFKKEKDARRQKRLESLGVRFLRFWDGEVKDDTGGATDNPPRSRYTPSEEGIGAGKRQTRKRKRPRNFSRGRFRVPLLRLNTVTVKPEIDIVCYSQ